MAELISENISREFGKLFWFISFVPSSVLKYTHVRENAVFLKTYKCYIWNLSDLRVVCGCARLSVQILEAYWEYWALVLWSYVQVWD